MSSQFKIGHLCDHPHLLPMLSDWIYNQFWTDVEGVTVDDLVERFSEAVGADRIPLALILFLNDMPIGTVSLIESDDDQRTYLTPWLAALYVLPEHRNKGAGAFLVQELLGYARALKVSELYLGTERPDFYERLGAAVIEQPSSSFSILRFHLNV